jgi:GAF domain-containing protein
MNSESPTSVPGLTTSGLNAVIATSELALRSNRAPDQKAESHAEMELTLELARAPHDFFKKLVNMVLKLSLADSAGISLLDEKNGRFVWPAVAGGLDPYVGGGTPSNFGPCGTVLDRNEPLLFVHPERHFTYLEPILPPLEEVLLIPFHVDGKAVGTIWAVIHRPDRKFQSEDRRLLVNLSAFASSAYKVLSTVGALEPLLSKTA